MEDAVVPLGRNLYGHPLAGLLWERQFEEILLEHGWVKVHSCECLFVHRGKRMILDWCVWMTSKLTWKETKILIRCGTYSINMLTWDNLHHSLIMFTGSALKDNVKQAKILLTITESCSNPEFPQKPRKKLPSPANTEYFYVVLRYRRSCQEVCVERYCELADKTTQQLYKVSTPCIDDHQSNEEEVKSMGELSDVCSQFVLKCVYLARIGGTWFFYVQFANLHVQTLSGPELATKA